MVRVHFIGRVSPHEMEDGEFTSRMVVCPSGQVEDLIVVDDEMVSCDDALPECAGGNGGLGSA